MGSNSPVGHAGCAVSARWGHSSSSASMPVLLYSTQSSSSESRTNMVASSGSCVGAFSRQLFWTSSLSSQPALSRGYTTREARSHRMKGVMGAVPLPKWRSTVAPSSTSTPEHTAGS